MILPKLKELDFWELNLPLEDLTLQGIILAFSAFIGLQSYKMNGCIRRIEGHLGISKRD